MPMHDDDDDVLGLGSMIRREATRHAAPAGLAERIAAELRASAAPARATASTEAEAHAASPTPSPTPARTPARASAAARPWRRWLESVLVFGAGAATAWALVGSVLLTPASDRIGDEIAASHVRSLLATHLTDVASTDRHTVKPWFAGKLDFSPPVHDLAAQGYALSGGRLDVIAGRSVAALVYRDHDHVINLFVWPAQSGHAMTTQTQTRQGYNITGWAQNGMQFWAVSDASAPELQGFSRTLQARIASGAP